MKNQNKTVATSDSVATFLTSVDDTKRADTAEIIRIMQEVSGEAPKMWGASIIGFGTYHYVYASGREGDWMKLGFSPRKAAFSLYLSCDADVYEDELQEFGKHTRGKGCIYFKKLDDIDRTVLRRMLKKAYTETNDSIDTRG